VNCSGPDFVATRRCPFESLRCDLGSTLHGVSITRKEEKCVSRHLEGPGLLMPMAISSSPSSQNICSQGYTLLANPINNTQTHCSHRQWFNALLPRMQCSLTELPSQPVHLGVTQCILPSTALAHNTHCPSIPTQYTLFFLFLVQPFQWADTAPSWGVGGLKSGHPRDWECEVSLISSSGLSIRHAVLLYKQLICPMMDHACII
jgi:hypothetical protein